jgi:DNA-binding NtrC family response regulator
MGADKIYFDKNFKTTGLDAKGSRKSRILLVDDDPDTLGFLKIKLMAENYEIDQCLCGEEALDRIRRNIKLNGSSGYSLILCDLLMPKINGLHFINEARKLEETSIVIMTAFASIETAVEAMRIGADDYIIKPLNIAELKIVIQRVIKDNLAKKTFESDLGQDHDFHMSHDLIGTDPQMQNVLRMIKKVSRASVNVLLSGQSGTGKELVAQSIHRSGPRAQQAFVAVNCTAIPETLLESELFGHAKGSFTGAISRRKGLIECAEGGTLFLDEIGDMPQALQGKLLRFIQEREYKLVGENLAKHADVRIIAATHRDLKKECKAGKFREDLYYRLNVICIEIPPLKNRINDIPLLAKHFLKKYQSLSPQITGFSEAALKKMMMQNWPGNIRELENTIERAMVFCTGRCIEESDIEVETDREVAREEANPDIFNCGLTLREVEKRYIEYVLRKTSGKKEIAAQLLGIDRKTLYRKEIEINMTKSH